MHLFGLLKRTPVTPPAVIRAACNFYGLSPECIHAIQATKLKALSNNVWVVKLNEQSSAVVAYNPKEEQEAIAAPWYME
jgi:hypothetical protein